MRTCGVIVAGGRSTRMGREKAFEMVRGRTIIARVIACLSEQVDAVAINANGDPARFESLGLRVFPDRRGDIGTPLAGLHAALTHARDQGFDLVFTVPSDAPFLPHDFVSRLAHPAAIASSGGQAHYLTGLWSPALLSDLERAMAETQPLRVQDWARRCSATIVEWPVSPFDPFFNVNTLDELAEAERIAAEFDL